MAASTFPAYLALTAALVVTPGATTAVVVRNTLGGGRRAGIAAAAGAAAGNTTHAVAAGLGVALLVSRSPMLLDGIRFAGGLFLAWLSVQSIRRVVRREPVAALQGMAVALSHRPTHRALREGVLVNLLNPAIITFYLAVVPTFVAPDAPRAYHALLAATHVAMAFTMHCAWAFGFDELRHVFERSAARIALEALTGAALLILAWLTIRSTA